MIKILSIFMLAISVVLAQDKRELLGQNIVPSGTRTQPVVSGGEALPVTWKGACSMPPIKTDYPLLLQIDKQQGSNIVGVMHHPKLNDSKTKFKGTLVNNHLAFTEYELIRGKGVYLPTEYTADITGDKMEGTWKTRILFIPIKGRFRLERQKLE